jgi:hypothetical protein
MKKPTLLPHQDDALLREAGFRIVSRPKGQDPVWAKDKGLYGVTEALQLAKRIVIVKRKHAKEKEELDAALKRKSSEGN